MGRNAPGEILKARGGFVLLEGLMAALVLSVGILAVFQGFAASKNSIQSARENLRAQYVLQNAVWLAETSEEVPDISVRDSVLPDAILEIQDVEESSAPWKRRNVSLRWGKKDREKNLESTAVVPAVK